jgi:hypothetical protein
MLMLMALDHAGGYYFDTGACAKVTSCEIKVKTGEIAAFRGDTVVFKDGSTAKPGIVVFATGYTGFSDTIRMILGEKWIKQCCVVGHSMKRANSGVIMSSSAIFIQRDLGTMITRLITRTGSSQTEIIGHESCVIELCSRWECLAYVGQNGLCVQIVGNSTDP